MIKALVTGADGFVGAHLIDLLSHSGIEIIAAVKEDNSYKSTERNGILVIGCDLADKKQLKKINLSDVDVVIHLAGLASNLSSFNEVQEVVSLNSLITTNLFNHVLTSKKAPRIIVISSGAIYSPTQKLPLLEKSETLASSPYVISKLLIEQLCEYYRLLGLNIVIARPFNHIGPGQRTGFIVPDLINETNHSVETKEAIKVGNLKTKRDYTDVRDVVEAYKLLATAEKLDHDVYNICSGRSISGEQILNQIFESMDLKETPKIEVDSSKIRPNDSPEIYGDYSRIRDELGWEPKILLKQTIDDIIRLG